MTNRNILFLSAWYPNRYDAMDGLFVRKHAEAASRHANVAVLFLKEAPENKKIEIEENDFGNVHEFFIYYPSFPNSCIHKIKKTISWIYAYRIGYKHVLGKWGRPDLIHANILTRTGIIACFINKMTGIPFVITEHWSRYFPENFGFNGHLRKLTTHWVIKNASAVLPISDMLKNAMQRCGILSNRYKVIYNVVDDFFFQKEIAAAHDKKMLLHVSCFYEPAKNVKGILRAISSLKEKRMDFELVIIGTGVDFQSAYDYAGKLDLLDCITFVGEKSPQEVAQWMHRCDAFVMFSNFETACVTIMESLACGKPVVTTPVGIVETDIHTNNGVITPCGDERQLTQNLDWMLDHYLDYDGKAISSEAYKRYSYETISLKLAAIYDNAIKKH